MNSCGSFHRHLEALGEEPIVVQIPPGSQLSPHAMALEKAMKNAKALQLLGRVGVLRAPFLLIGDQTAATMRAELKPEQVDQITDNDPRTIVPKLEKIWFAEKEFGEQMVKICSRIAGTVKTVLLAFSTSSILEGLGPGHLKDEIALIAAHLFALRRGNGLRIFMMPPIYSKTSNYVDLESALHELFANNRWGVR